MANINIVLVEPQIPQNTGNVARTCAVTGAALHLVRPMGFEVDDKKLKRAGLDYWHDLDLRYYQSMDDFLEKTDGPYVFFTSRCGVVYTQHKYPPGVFLVFGREDAGLSEPLLRRFPNCLAQLPMQGGARCLNLSSTVAVAAYEALRCQGFTGLQVKHEINIKEQ